MTFKEMMDHQSDGEVADQQRTHHREQRAHEMAPGIERLVWKRARQQKREQERSREQKAEVYSLYSVARISGDLGRIRSTLK